MGAIVLDVSSQVNAQRSQISDHLRKVHKILSISLVVATLVVARLPDATLPDTTLPDTTLTDAMLTGAVWTIV